MPAPSSAHRRSRRLALALTLAVTTLAVAPGGRADAAPIYYNGAGNAPTISVIGDSTIAALRWTGTFEPLQRFNYVYDAESCRRTIDQSCGGREGFAPDNVIGAMRRLSGDLGEVLALMVGYDDPGFSFAQAVDAVMAEAAAQGIPTVMWLTLRTADVTYVGPTYSSNTYTFRDNNRILLQKAQQYGGRLQIADWATYSASRSDWVTSDGIHLTLSGAWAAADYIADQAARVIGGETVTPQPGVVPILPWVSLRFGDRGASVVALQEALMERGYAIFGGADGVFGSTTQAVIRRFQSANGIEPSGVVDDRTATLLGLNNAGGVAAPATWVGLRLGMGGVGVAEAQRALMDAGIFVRGGATGEFDVYTYYAVNTFQRLNSLSVTGVIDTATAKALGLHSGDWIDLRLGMTGDSVRRAQQALRSGGVYLANGVNSRFDVATYYAVRTFQRFQRLPVTGVVDGITATALGLRTGNLPSAVWSGLVRDTSGKRVAAAQRALMNAGIFVRGGATGVFDVYTYYAVNTFQRLNGLPVTGVLDVATARALGLFDLSNPTATWRDLSIGSVGPTVAAAERALIAAGVHVAKGVDRSYGLDNYYAVATFQRYNRLPVTGIIDVATARKLGLLGGASNPTVLVLAAAPAPTTTTSTTTTSSTTSTTTPRSTTTTRPTAPAPRPTTTAAPPVAQRSAAPAAAATTAATDPEAGTATIAGAVWHDANGDGRRDPRTDAGVPGAEVVLVSTAGAELTSTRSEWDGSYEFADLEPGVYLVELTLPPEAVPTPAHQGTDPTADSDLTTPVDSTGDGIAEAYRTDPVSPTDDHAVHTDLGLLAAPAEDLPADSTLPTSEGGPPTSEPAVTSEPPERSEPMLTTEPTVATSEPATETSEPATTTEPTVASSEPPAEDTTPDESARTTTTSTSPTTTATPTTTSQPTTTTAADA